MAAPPLVIDEVRLPIEIARGAVGGPMFSTIVATGGNAAEKRIAQWVLGRRRWDVSHARRDPAQANELAEFFYARRGRLYGFRFQDPEDHTATLEPLYPTGAPTVQLERTYTSGPVSSRRPIYKPVEATGIVVNRNDVLFIDYTVDWNSGTLFLTADSTKTITNISQAAAAVIDATAHGFSIGDKIWIEGVVGMTEINDTIVTITAVNTDDFTISLDTTGFTAYVSGGLAIKYVQPTEDLDWTGEFDIPARFDTDECLLVQADVTVRDWDAVPIIELIGVPDIVEPEPPVEPTSPVEMVLMFRFEDSPGITDNEGTGGSAFDLTESGICEG